MLGLLVIGLLAIRCQSGLATVAPPTEPTFPTVTVQSVLPEESPVLATAQALPLVTPSLTLTMTSAPTLQNQTEPPTIYLIQLQGRPDSVQQAQFLTQLENQFNHPIEVVYQYNTTYNGFALKLTPQEAKWVATLPTVRQVQADLKRFPQDNPQQSND
jgi:hypothetical protein